jgi:hypothetical protein
MEEVRRRNDFDISTIFDLLHQRLPTISLAELLNPSGAETMRLWDARTLLLDVDDYFDT